MHKVLMVHLFLLLKGNKGGGGGGWLKREMQTGCQQAGFSVLPFFGGFFHPGNNDISITH